MPSQLFQLRSPKVAQLAQVIEWLGGVETQAAGVRLIKFSQQGQILRLLLALENDGETGKAKRTMQGSIRNMAAILKAADISMVQIYYTLNQPSQSAHSKPQSLATVHLNHTLQTTESDPFLQLSRCLCMAR